MDAITSEIVGLFGTTVVGSLNAAFQSFVQHATTLKPKTSAEIDALLGAPGSGDGQAVVSTLGAMLEDLVGAVTGHFVATATGSTSVAVGNAVTSTSTPTRAAAAPAAVKASPLVPVPTIVSPAPVAPPLPIMPGPSGAPADDGSDPSGSVLNSAEAMPSPVQQMMP